MRRLSSLYMENITSTVIAVIVPEWDNRQGWVVQTEKWPEKGLLLSGIIIVD